MKKYLLNSLLTFSVLLMCNLTNATDNVDVGGASNSNAVIENYHGQKYIDEFGWLRDTDYPIINDPQILKFIAEENDNSDSFFKQNKILLDTVYE